MCRRSTFLARPRALTGEFALRLPHCNRSGTDRLRRRLIVRANLALPDNTSCGWRRLDAIRTGQCRPRRRAAGIEATEVAAVLAALRASFGAGVPGVGAARW